VNWRPFFLVILLFSCVDGFIVNLLYPAKLPMLYRDFLVLFTYLLFFSQEPAGQWFGRVYKRMGPFIWGFGLLFFVICVFQVFNPLLPNIAVGLLGLKVAVFYWPLLLLSYAYHETPRQARRFLWWIVALSVPIHLFGMYQFIKGPEYLADTFGPGFDRATVIAFFEGAGSDTESFLRVPGTFASSGQYTSFVIIDIAYIFALFLSSHKKWERLLLRAIAILSFVVLLATGSRGGILAISIITILLGLFYSGARRFVSLALLAGVGLFLGFHFMGEGVTKRFETLRDVTMLSERTIDTEPLQFADAFKEAPLGMGVGKGSIASRHLVDMDTFDIRLIENHLTKLQLETGIFGVVTFYVFALGLIQRLLLPWRNPSNKQAGALLGPLSAYCLTTLVLSFVAGNFDSPPASLFFWATLGLIIRVSEQSPAT